MRTGSQMGDLLVSKGWVSASDLYKQMQANLARKILDCFRWPDARYRIKEGADPAETAVRMNSVQLILTGIASFLPFEVVASQMVFTDDQAFGLAPQPAHSLEDLRLSAKDSKFMNALRQRPVFAKLLERTGLETEEALRKLYSFCVLGLAGAASAMPQAPTPVPPAPVAAPPPPPAAMVTKTPDDEPPAFKDALTRAFLDHRSKDPFDLLGVPVEVAPAALRKAFLALADQFSPTRCTTQDSREKAEGLLVAYARAYAGLADPEQLALWKKRREAARAPKKSDTAAQVFKISTTLLDARSQFAEAKRRLEAGNHRGALEYFEYACDIEPKPLYRAHLAWTRYVLTPLNARLALTELAEVVKVDPECEPAHLFMAEIHRAQKSPELAEEAYRKAFKVNPQNRKAIELAQEMAKLKKR
jgi:tetratricopeptide (TPR) repeat protein